MPRKKTTETAEEVVEVQEVPTETAEEVVEGYSSKLVTLTKDEVSFTLSDPIMISAFENQGYKLEGA